MIAEQAEIPSTVHPTQRGYLKPSRKQVPSPRWAQAFEQYVSGQLATFEAVSAHLNIGNTAVRRRALKEGWKEAREARAKLLREQVGKGPGIAPEMSKETLLELGNTQTALAKSALSYGQMALSLLTKTCTDVSLLSAKLTDMQPCSPAMEPSISRIEALTKLSESLLDQVRVLAGLPEPGRANPKPSTSTVPAPAHDPAMFQPVGLAQEEGGGGA